LAERKNLIVISNNGRTTVLTGWRAWLAGTAAFLGLAAVPGILAFVLLGVAVTVGAVLLIVVPVAIGVAILASFFRPPNVR
jgi:hypothetical protein